MTKLHRQVIPGTGASPAGTGVAPGRISRSASLPARPPSADVATTGPDPTAGLLPAGEGAPLPARARSTFEQSLGADLGAVRVHTGADSAQAAEAVGAHAFAVGNDIHFGAGRFQPDDPFGLHLLAHEVAHTQQQAGSSPTVQHQLELSQPADASELEADRAADAMVQGAPARVTGGAGAAIARTPVGPVYNKATHVGPNLDKTIDWNNPPQLYGLAGDQATSLREQYRAHLRTHLGTEPDIVALGAGLDPEAIVARLADLEQRQKDAVAAAAAAAVDATTDATDAASDAVGGMIGGMFDGGDELHQLGDVLEQPRSKRKPAPGRPEVDVEACRKALWRSAQRAIADTLSTETSDARYKKKGGTTYCNVYATDMVNAMGGYLPRVWYADLGIARKMSQEEMKKNNVPVVELSANNIGAWLNKWGGDFGWTRTKSAKEAQEAANAGRVAIIQASKIDGVTSGHVGVIMAEGNGHAHTTGKDGSYQPLQSQAGASNFQYSDTPPAGAGISDSWWKGEGMKEEPDGNFYIYKGAHQATAVTDAASMGKLAD